MIPEAAIKIAVLHVEVTKEHIEEGLAASRAALAAGRGERVLSRLSPLAVALRPWLQYSDFGVGTYHVYIYRPNYVGGGELRYPLGEEAIAFEGACTDFLNGELFGKPTAEPQPVIVTVEVPDRLMHGAAW